MNREHTPHRCTTPRCGGDAIASGNCRRCYAYTRRHGHPPDLTGPQLGDPAGHGAYGRLTREQDGVLCHECGDWPVALPPHARQAHGLTAAEYRERYGLSRGLPLVSLGLSAAMSVRSRARVGSPGWRRLEARRDPAAASHARDRDAMIPPPAAAQLLRARAAAHAARAAQLHTCAVCGGQIPNWRGADDNRTLCGRDECRRETSRLASERSAATRRAQGRELTAAERARLLEMTPPELAAEIPRLYADGVRQVRIAEAMGVSPSSVGRIVPYRNR